MRRVRVPWLIVGAASAALTAVTCGGSDTNTTTSTGTGGGSSTSTGTGGSSSGPSSSSGGCTELWTCTPWQTDGTSDAATRVCTDQNSCGTTANKPVESATLPALDLEYYKCNVEPIFDRGCSQLACHGTETGRSFRVYARGRLRITGDTLIEPGCLNPGKMVPSENCIGSIECACWTVPHTPNEWRRNYDAARSFALDSQGMPLGAGNEAQSELIAQPVVGGKPHAGVHLFTTGDADYQTLTSWLGGAQLGMTCNTTN